MQINVYSKQLEMTPAIEEYAKTKAEKPNLTAAYGEKLKYSLMSSIMTILLQQAKIQICMQQSMYALIGALDS